MGFALGPAERSARTYLASKYNSRIIITTGLLVFQSFNDLLSFNGSTVLLA